MANRLDPKVVDALLDKLSTDDDFRERFQKDPEAALGELGGGDFDEASCLQVKRLATKDVMKAARVDLRRQFEAAMGFSPHKLEA